MSIIQRFKDPQVALFWLALLRIMMGVLFLTTWASNLAKGFYAPDGLIQFFTDVFPQSQNSLVWYASFIDNAILPIREFFSPFQLVTEFLIGLFLLVGLFTPYTSVAAAFFVLNTFLATFGHDWPWSYGMMLAILMILFFTRTGRSLGIDAALARRKQKPPLPYLW